MSDPAAQYRAEIDFEISFSNGGGLRGEAFRIDIGDPGITESELAAALITDLGLLMADRVEIRRYRIIRDGTSGRSQPTARGTGARRPAGNGGGPTSAMRSRTG